MDSNDWLHVIAMIGTTASLVIAAWVKITLARVMADNAKRITELEKKT